MSLNMFIKNEQQEPSLEAIDFQYNSKLVDELLAAIKELGKNFSSKKCNELLPDVLKRLTGLTFKFETGKFTNAYVYWPETLKDSPLMGIYHGLHTDQRDDVEKAFKKLKDYSWGFDRRTGKITGSPTETVFKSGLGAGIFSDSDPSGKRFTAKMRVGILLHEVGHINSFFEWSYRMSTTNFILSGVADKIWRGDGQERLVIIKKMNDEGHLRGITTELMNSKDIDEIRLLCYDSEVKKSRRDLGTDIYDERNWEVLADQYVARLGYGLDLAKALSAIGFAPGYLEKFLVDVYQAIWLFWAYSAVSMAFTGATIPIISLFLISGVLILGTDASAGTYDEPRRRFEAIRNGLIKSLGSAPKEAVGPITKNIEELDALISGTPSDLSLYQFIGKIFFPIRRRQYRELRAQQLLEDFSASRARVIAARLEEGM